MTNILWSISEGGLEKKYYWWLQLQSAGYKALHFMWQHHLLQLQQWSIRNWCEGLARSVAWQTKHSLVVLGPERKLPEAPSIFAQSFLKKGRWANPVCIAVLEEDQSEDKFSSSVGERVGLPLPYLFSCKQEDLNTVQSRWWGVGWKRQWAHMGHSCPGFFWSPSHSWENQ